MAPLSAAPDLDWPDPVPAAVEDGRVAPELVLLGFEYPLVVSAGPFGRTVFEPSVFIVRVDIGYLLCPT